MWSPWFLQSTEARLVLDTAAEPQDISSQIQSRTCLGAAWLGQPWRPHQPARLQSSYAGFTSVPAARGAVEDHSGVAEQSA